MFTKIEKAFAKVMGGTKNEREAKRLQPRVNEINEIAEGYKKLTDDELKAKTLEFKYRLRMGETLDDILPEAFAAVKDTCRRLVGKKWLVRGQEIEWNMIPYDVQILGGIVLHEGKIAEMATGEGKTLVATFPLYLNALEGKGAHLITVNDYLAQRDREWMGAIYDFLGLRTAALHNDMDPNEKRQAYNADITYGTNNEFGFDYLRDNMAVDIWSVVQRGLHYAIVDEVDSVLIDEARTPLIISGAVGAPRNVYYELKPVVANLYKRQKELVDRLVKDGKELLEKDADTAALMMLRAQRGNPKNPALLEILTSEFWVKKLIERLQGQYEINKTMSEVDAELYYIIDEKTHVLDITEKGRIFLSGGRDQDVAQQIVQLDKIDDLLANLSEQKNASRYFTTDSITGYCDGLTLEGKIALCGATAKITDEDTKFLDTLDKTLNKLNDHINDLIQNKKTDKASAWRQYFNFAKKGDRIINGLTTTTLEFIQSAEQNSSFKELVDFLPPLFEKIKQEADVDEGPASRSIQDKRRVLQETFFVAEKQFGCPIGLTEDGKAALIALKNNGNPMLVPFIAKLNALLKNKDISSANNGTQNESDTNALNERKREYFDFSHNGTIVRNITEKGRIAILGGNPDIYVLPDRSIVELRDSEIQKIMDQTLNQVSFDYAARATSVERLAQDLQEIGEFITNSPEGETENNISLFYQVDTQTQGDQTSVYNLKVTDIFNAFISDFSDQTRSVVSTFDKNLQTSRQNLKELFSFKEEKIVGLAPQVKDRLLGYSYTEIENKIKEWRETHTADQNDNSISLRFSLDAFLNSSVDQADIKDTKSISRRFEEVERIARIMNVLFSNLYRSDLTSSEKQRLLKRYFELDADFSLDTENIDQIRFNGLSDNGVHSLLNDADDRQQIAERLLALLDNSDIELDAIFELSENNYPTKLRKAVNSQLLDGLPFFSFSDEYRQFREEILRLSSKKVNTRAELDSIIAKDKAHLRAKKIILDDGELNELISKAHAPNTVLTPEEIEHWCRLYFDRKPRKLLENQRDRLWREYNDIEERIQNISQLLRAYTLYHKDIEYVVKSVDEVETKGRNTGTKGRKAVMIVDQFTGRLMPGRRFSDGLHEALEAKEGVEVQSESQTLATVTIQNFFRIYEKLAGMTGTAETEAQEFFSTYKLEVLVIPTNKPVVRDDQNDVIYRTKLEKYNAVIDEAIEMHNNGRPVLIGTVSVDVSQKLSQMFTQRGVPIANWLKKGDVSRELESGRFHTVLNAKYHQNEAEIVAKAGMPGAITIATNMAGRGTDIKLSPEVIEKGGLHIVGSEKHEARRIDRQLRGRSGRQGDAGSSRFFLSLEDDLMRLFGSDRIANIMTKLGPSEDGERIEHPLITRSIERAQKKVEERNFDIRKNLLQYDDVLNEQRKIIYKRRQNLMGFAQASDFVESKTKIYFSEENNQDEWHLKDLIQDLQRFFNREPDFTEADLESQNQASIKETIETWIDDRLQEDKHLKEMQLRHRIMGYCSMNQVLAELVKIKIRLHDAGTKDISVWNFKGIQYEIERIFKSYPDFIQNPPADLTAGQFEKQLVDWVIKKYASMVQENLTGINESTFAELTIDEMINIFLAGLMTLHLNSSVPSVSWNTDEFFDALERVFLDQPNIGHNEIKTIRRDKIRDLLQEWITSLSINENDHTPIRHRILGYFSLQNFVNSILEYLITSNSEGNGKDKFQFNAEQHAFLKRVFKDLQIPSNSEDDRSVSQIVNSIHSAFTKSLQNNMTAYDAFMLSHASIEEFIEASIMAVCKEMLNPNEISATTQQQLSQRLYCMFLQKPQKSIPESTDVNTLASFTEELIAWGSALYEDHAYREERLSEEKLSSEIVRDSVLMSIDDAIYSVISNVLGNETDLDDSAIPRIQAESRLLFRQSPRLQDDSDERMDPNLVMDKLSTWAQNLYRKRVSEIGDNLAIRYERYYILDKIDENWRQHLNAMDELREGIGLRGYGQKDPLLEYKSEGYKMFVKMIDRVNRDVVSTLFKIFDIGGEIEEKQIRRVEPRNFRTSHSQVEIYKQTQSTSAQNKNRAAEQSGRQRTIVNTTRVGRNDPCPCGSGKKYKQCCGKNM